MPAKNGHHNYVWRRGMQTLIWTISDYCWSRKSNRSGRIPNSRLLFTYKKKILKTTNVNNFLLQETSLFFVIKKQLHNYRYGSGSWRMGKKCWSSFCLSFVNLQITLPVSLYSWFKETESWTICKIKGILYGIGWTTLEFYFQIPSTGLMNSMVSEPACFGAAPAPGIFFLSGAGSGSW